LSKSKTTEGDAVTLSREGEREGGRKGSVRGGRKIGLENRRVRGRRGVEEEIGREGVEGEGGRGGGREGGWGGTYLGVVGVGEADGDGALEAEHPQWRGVGKVL